MVRMLVRPPCWRSSRPPCATCIRARPDCRRSRSTACSTATSGSTAWRAWNCCCASNARSVSRCRRTRCRRAETRGRPAGSAVQRAARPTPRRSAARRAGAEPRCAPRQAFPPRGDAPAERRDAARACSTGTCDAHPDQTQVILPRRRRRACRISYRQLADVRRGARGRPAARRAAAARSAWRSCCRPRPSTSSPTSASCAPAAIPVPIYPPARASQLEDHVRRHTGILANAQAVLLVTVPEAMVVARLLQARVPRAAPRD